MIQRPSLRLVCRPNGSTHGQLKRDTLIDPLQLTQLDFYLPVLTKALHQDPRWALNYRSDFENILERPPSKRVGSLPGGLPK
jgi:hypothetical protein